MRSLNIPDGAKHDTLLASCSRVWFVSIRSLESGALSLLLSKGSEEVRKLRINQFKR